MQIFQTEKTLVEKIIQIEGINITFTRKSKSKFIRLRIEKKTGTPIVSMPFFCPLDTAKTFAIAHIVWIKKHIESKPRQILFKDKDCISLLGQQVTICHRPSDRSGVRQEQAFLFVSGKVEHLHRRVTDFIKQQVKDYATIHAKSLALKQHKKIFAISVKDTTSRWGSCSTSVRLSFCWRLGLAPLFVLDYVIAHEVGHLTQMNHSWLFWQNVAQIAPESKKAEKWLKNHSKDLNQYR